MPSPRSATRSWVTPSSVCTTTETRPFAALCCKAFTIRFEQSSSASPVGMAMARASAALTSSTTCFNSASGRSRSAALYSAAALAGATLAGVLVIELIPGWLPYGLPISAGVALYVAATDLVPEVNREPGIRMALVFFAGVGAFLLLRELLPAL